MSDEGRSDRNQVAFAPPTAHGQGSALPVTITATSRFAKAWFDDAKREAAPETVGDPHARRREIVFSAHCLESYLVEWTATRLAQRFSEKDLYDVLRDYFPLPTTERGRKRSPTEQWISIPQRLHADGFLSTRLAKYTPANAQAFEQLIAYRNSVTHADLSFPVVLGPTGDLSIQARLTVSDLGRLEPGWAVSIAGERIRQLHRKTKTLAPGWIPAAQ